MREVFSVSDVRAAEAALMEYQRHPDELMQLAARGVAAAADVMIKDIEAPRVLVLVGPGGNGGDGLYGTAFLIDKLLTASADALLVGTSCHERAKEEFKASGGEVINAQTAMERIPDYDLVIDAVAGLASERHLTEPARGLFRAARHAKIPVLSIDVPTGINADNGHHSLNPDDFVTADVTITFGWLRPAHAFAPECGQVVLCDLQLPKSPESFAECLDRLGEPVAYASYEPSLKPSPRISATSTYTWPKPLVYGNPKSVCRGEASIGKVTAPQPIGCTGPIADPTPGYYDHKYSLGVVAVCAGSETYPGAGVLAAAGALGTSGSMVRVIGAPDVVRTHPEVVLHPDVASAGRAQCWVVGPGRGKDRKARAEVAAVLALGIPTSLDADALTILAEDELLRDAVRAHPLVILTPHAGEFERLYLAEVGEEMTPNRGENVQRLAKSLNAVVLQKGRINVISFRGAACRTVNCGNSYAATPGSGDVLSGVLGKTIARLNSPMSHVEDPANCAEVVTELLHGVAIHAHAASVAAETPDGYAPTTASRIASALPQAVARLLSMER